MKTKTQFTNRILSLVLSIMMVVSMLPTNVFTASAAEGTETSVTGTATIDLSQYSEGATIDISEDCKIIGDGNEYNISLNITENATVTFDIGTSGVKLGAPITVADGKTLTLLVKGDAEHTVNGGISLGNGSDVIIEGDLDKPNNKLTVTGTNGNAGIGANNGVTAGDITIRNARVDATGSSKEVSMDQNPEIFGADTSISGAAIGTSDGSMGDILIENSIIVAEGGYYESTSHAAPIGIGYVGSTMGDIILKNSQITAANNGDGLASVIGAGANHHVFVSGSLGDIVITNTELNLSVAVSTKNWYAAVIGSGIGFSHGYVNMGKIIFTDVTQAELDEMIPTWLPSDFNESQGYALGRGNDGSIYKYDAFGGVWVSDGNGGTVQIGDESGYYIACKNGGFVHDFDEICGGTCSDCGVTYYVVHTMGTAATCTAKAVCSVCGESYGEVDGDAHNYGDWVSNGDNTHTRTCANDSTHTENGDCSGGTATCKEHAVCDICKTAYGALGGHTAEPTYAPNAEDSTKHDVTYSCCGATVTEAHTLDVTTGKCGECGADMTAIATVTDGTNTYYAADAATLNQAVTAILETGSRTFTVELPADAEAEMITAIRRAICDTEGVADGSIHLTLKGVTTIPGTTNWDGVAFGPGDIYDEAGKIVDQELVTQLASVNLPDVTEIGAQAFYFCENLVAVSAPKAQTIGAQALGYTALTSVEFPELTTIPTDMFSGTWTLSSAKFPKVTTIEQGGLLVGAKFTPENNPTPFPLELTAEGNITFNGSNHFNIASQNYSGKVDLVLCCDKKDAVTFHDDGTATWQVRNDLSYTFKSITFKHSYVDGKCTACGEDCTHTGGTATCTTLAVCDICKTAYGELGGHTYNTAGSCTVCGAACPHSNFDSATGNCKDCEISLAIAKIKTGETTIYYQTADDLRTAIESSGDDQAITLLADLAIKDTFFFNANGTKNTLDLNGHTLICSDPISERILLGDCELAITGTGSINIFIGADSEGAKIVVGSGVTLNNSLRSAYGGILDLTNATIPEAGLNVILYSDYWDPTTYNVSDVLLLPADYYFFVDGKAVYTYTGETEGTVLKHTEHSYTYTDNGDGTHDATCSVCGKMVDNEAHTLTYTANGNTIAAACSANCGYSGTATISATGKTYDGNAVEVVVSKTGSLENMIIPVTLTKDGEAFTGEPVNAGAYTASVTLGNKTVSVNFTIAKAEVSIATAPTPNTLTYIGDAQYLISTGEAVGGTMVYSLTENGDYTTTIPHGTNAGDYTVWYYVQGDANHKDSAKDSVAVTIAKATPTAEDFVFAAPTDLIYDGTAKPAAITVKNGIVGMGEVNIIYFRDAGMWIDNEREPIYPGRYKVGIWIKEGDNYKAVYSDERIWLGDEFEIKYLTTDAKADISGTMGSNGWYTSEVTLSAPEGYQISKTKYNDGFESKLTISAEQNETITYYLKDANGDVAEKAVELKIDKTAPSAQYQIGTNGWKQFINTITFGLFCKDYKTVDIEYTDELSGVAEKQYYISSEEITDTNSIAWLDYTDTLSLNATGKYFIYMRVVDNAGHEVILNTEGIVIYEDSVQVTESVSATYNAGTDKAVTVKLNGNTVNAIKNENAVLTAGTDYTVSADGTITLKASYLDALNAGEYTFTVSYNPQGVETDKVNMTTTFTVEVEKADGKVSNLNISSKTYDGTAVTAPTFDKLGDGAATIEYKLSDADDNTYTTTAPKNAGNYVVRVTVAEGTNHKETSATTYFAIASAELRDVSVQQVGTLTYTGEALTPAVSANAVAVNNQPITFTYSTETEGPYSTEIPSFTNVGWAHTVYYIATADNHNTYYGSFLVEIEKATVTEPTIASKPYNGSAQTADIGDTDLYTVEKNNGGTEKGSYDVVLKLKDSANYKWSTTNNVEVTLQFVISAAQNAWDTNPSISGWTYGEAAKTPVGTAKYGAVKVVYTGKANDGTDYNSETAPTKAGNYTATFTVAGTEDYSSLYEQVDFAIAKANYDMSGAKWDYTEPFRYDGKEHKVEVVGLPAGVTVESYENNTATAVGDYYAEVNLTYDAHNYNAPTISKLGWTIYNDWSPTEYAATTPNGNGWLNSDFVITANDGYKVALTNTADGDWKDALTYSAETADGSVTFYLKNETDGTISLAKTVSYKIDKTVPVGKVEFAERTGWEEFVNTITFGLLYNDEVTVQATANDNLSGVDKIEYASADKAMTLDEVKVITDWTEYTNSFGVTLEDAKKFVYFVRITDKAGNATYLSTDGAEYDTTAPVIDGVENGKTYYTTQKVTVTEKNVDTITLNGNPATENITLAGNKEATYTIVVTDKAGNTTTVTVTMKPIKALASVTENLGNDNVTSDDAPDLEELVETLDALLADEDVSDGERETLEQHKHIAESLLATIEAAAEATDTENTEKVENVTPENVTPENKTDLEGAKADLEKALEDNRGNYTEDEKKAIEDEIKRIDEALEVIGNVEEVEETISKLPAVDTVKPDDEEAIKAITDAQTAYNALSDYEKSLVDEATKAALDKLAAALVAYDIVEGDGSSWTEDSDHNITFVVNGLFSKFVGIKVDAKDVDKANYEVKAGSTIITLKASYLDTLAVGEHTISVVYTDGSTDGTFNVHAKANSPATGDDFNIALYGSLVAVSVTALVVLLLVSKKRGQAR